MVQQREPNFHVQYSYLSAREYSNLTCVIQSTELDLWTIFHFLGDRKSRIFQESWSEMKRGSLILKEIMHGFMKKLSFQLLRSFIEMRLIR